MANFTVNTQYNIMVFFTVSSEYFILNKFIYLIIIIKWKYLIISIIKSLAI